MFQIGIAWLFAAGSKSRTPNPSRLPAFMFNMGIACLFAAGCKSRTLDTRPTPYVPSALPPAHYEITPESLPPPYKTSDARNSPDVVDRPEGAALTLPEGFRVTTYAQGGWKKPRWMALSPNGDVFVADADLGTLTLLRDENHDGVVDRRLTYAEGLNKPFGMAFTDGFLYVGNTDEVVRFAYAAGDERARGAPQHVADIPGRGYREHWTRNVFFNRDRTKLYVTVGSQTNVDAEENPERASILEMRPDGTGRRIFAHGTRNPIGLALHPTTGALWAAVQERDRLGDDLVPDYVTEVKDGGFYGWPFAYMGREDPRHKGERPELVAKTLMPDVLVQAHSAVLGLVFYEGAMFPAEYRGDAFVAFHGSWNRHKRTGYKVVRMRFRDGRPAGGYDDFLTGFMLGEDRKEVWGRPVGLLVLGDGSLLVTDDGGNKIWRVSYGQ